MHPAFDTGCTAGAEGFEPSTKVLETFAEPQYFVHSSVYIIQYIVEKSKTAFCSLPEHVLFFFFARGTLHYMKNYERRC